MMDLSSAASYCLVMCDGCLRVRPQLPSKGCVGGRWWQVGGLEVEVCTSLLEKEQCSVLFVV